MRSGRRSQTPRAAKKGSIAMTVNKIKYGISYLPEDCLAYKDGYRYGAFWKNTETKEMHIVEFFKTLDEVQQFVNNNREYGRA